MLAETATQAARCEVLALEGCAESTAIAAVNSILHDPDIAEVISHDHRAPGFISHPAVRYLVASVDEKLAGVFMLIQLSSIDTEIHAALLPWAKPQSRELGRACLAHVFKDPDLLRVSTAVMEGLGSALNYCLKLGFQREGFKPHACVKRGNVIGVHLLGMTREQWEALQ